MFTSTWLEAEDSKVKTKFPVRQIYVWLLDKNNSVVIVSKDGEKWQLPGGKPQDGEALEDAAIREVYEEAGLDIAPVRSAIKIFGYYEVEEIDEVSKKTVDAFTQVRALLLTEYDPSKLQPKEPEDAEAVKHAIAVPFSELPKYIPWVVEKKEYSYINTLVG